MNVLRSHYPKKFRNLTPAMLASMTVGEALRQIPLFEFPESKPLNLNNNPNLLSPPPEIVARDTEDILAFLRELHESGTIRFEAKLLVVGEGGTGKSSLLRALRGEDFDPELDTTHGIEVGKYPLPHPDSDLPELTLNTWDFGGQHIYHATHQFFLTQRSLYVVVWNARLGPDQGRLNYWLDTIKALAPDAPVLLVATHTDERSADLNYPLYTEAYPQLVGNLSVSNKKGTGIAELKDALAQHAAALPLMGQPWPQKWLDVEEELLTRPEHHINLDTYTAACVECGVDEEIARGTLGTYLHDLGKILYFRDDNVLCNLIVLKPNWVTKAISRVLTDDHIINSKGILRHADLPRIWATDEDGRRYDPRLYPVFLRLMERFDLSYQLADPGEQATASLVPQLLPHQPPAELPPWPETPPAGQAQVEMIYRLDFVPAGIMSWFIVRTHRYSRDLHWREGVMLAYEGHQARTELNPMLREIRLVVWGPQPHNFFTILKNTIDLILGRFEGLRIRREVPCICHWQRESSTPCSHFYSYDSLIKRMEAKRFNVQCDESYEDVSVRTLLFGIHESTNDLVLLKLEKNEQLLQEMKQGQNIIIQQNDQMRELLNRNFTKLWNYEMKKIEAECPNTFFLMPGSRQKFNPRNWVSQEYQLYLVCQHPAGPHGVGEGYSLRQAAEWWEQLSPWFSYLIQFLEFAVPMSSHLSINMQLTKSDEIQSSIELMKAITKSLSDQPALDAIKRTLAHHMAVDRQVAGPGLRVLHSFLKEADPTQHWSDLDKIVTPDGNILWLCAEHRLPYEVQPLVLDLPPED